VRRFLFLLVLAGCSAATDTSISGVDAADTGGGADSANPGRDSDEPEPDPTELENNLASGPGDFAVEFLAAAPYDSLVVEIDWVAGHEPPSESLDALGSALAELVNKPGGVDIVLDDELPPQGSPSWTVAETESLEVAWRDRYRDLDAGVAVLYYLYVDGNSSADTDSGRVLGYAYHGSSLIMFAETIADTESGLPLQSTVGEAVVVHELGHVLGLVNNGVPMVEPHQDTAHGHHDDDDGCIMYWAVETDAIVDLLLSGAPELDDACRADLAAAGGKAAR
jgi:hypothetical protein